MLVVKVEVTRHLIQLVAAVAERVLLVKDFLMDQTQAQVFPGGGDGGNGIRTLIAGPAPYGAGSVGTPGPSSAAGTGGGPSTDVTGG